MPAIEILLIIFIICSSVTFAFFLQNEFSFYKKFKNGEERPEFKKRLNVPGWTSIIGILFSVAELIGVFSTDRQLKDRNVFWNEKGCLHGRLIGLVLGIVAAFVYFPFFKKKWLKKTYPEDRKRDAESPPRERCGKFFEIPFVTGGMALGRLVGFCIPLA